MMINGHGRLNAIGTAVAIATLPALSDIERAAMEKMPIKDAMRNLAEQAQAELDAELQAAVEKFLGHPITEPEALRGRLAHVTFQGHEDDGTTYTVDGVPVLWVGPMTYERDGDMMKATRSIRQLLP